MSNGQMRFYICWHRAEQSHDGGRRALRQAGLRLKSMGVELRWPDQIGQSIGRTGRGDVSHLKEGRARNVGGGEDGDRRRLFGLACPIRAAGTSLESVQVVARQALWRASWYLMVSSSSSETTRLRLVLRHSIKEEVKRSCVKLGAHRDTWALCWSPRVRNQRYQISGLEPYIEEQVYTYFKYDSPKGIRQ